MTPIDFEVLQKYDPQTGLLRGDTMERISPEELDRVAGLYQRRVKGVIRKK